MPQRHSKNNNDEKRKLGYGSQKDRLGKDSIKPFIDPMCCQKGLAYCKECILECLFPQKRDTQRIEAEMTRFMSLMKFDVEKFDGMMNFGLWQVQIKDVLIQCGLHKALKGRPSGGASEKLSHDGGPTKLNGGSNKGSMKFSMSDDKWEEMDLRAATLIRLNLAKNILTNVHGISTAKELWEKLEAMYQANNMSNRLYLKEQFYTLQMEEGTIISDHMSVLNGIVFELEVIGVKIEDEDKALRFILSLPPSYEHMKPILMYGKEPLNFAETTSKLLLEERRLKRDERTSQKKSTLVASNRKKKENFV